MRRSWRCSLEIFSPEAQHYLVGEMPELTNMQEDNEPVEEAFSGPITNYLEGTTGPLAEGHEIVYEFYQNDPPEAVIESTHNVLTQEEALMHVEECREAIVKELQRWH